MSDPTYEKDLIDAKPEWQLAFLISELINDEAPIGWSRYVRLATSILQHYQRIPIQQDADE